MGSLTGQVCDASGRPVPGATVRVTSPSQTTQRTSNANGLYRFGGLVSGMHVLVVEKDGYAQGLYVNIAVVDGQETIANAVLNLRLIRWISLHDDADLTLARKDDRVYAVGAASYPR
ncbi:MAG TPA: carboxypeptidase-like regulatory domain-containing protein [Candidatus Acidoferrales bacterium]|nr:carboxypeptidase-like regulatory domain-containing protein [Candidatus Acidoferrales bacterium]